MKSTFYFLITASLIIVSCNSDKAPKTANNQIKKTEATSSNNDGPSFVMVDKSKSNIPIETADTIEVSTIEDIVSNADHNTVIKLKGADYKLNTNLVYYISNDKKEVINKNEVETRSVGGQIFVSDMTNFSIIGTKKGSKISSNNPKAVPLFIINAEQGSFENLTLGHNIPKSTASNVPSLYVTKSNKVSFKNCNLGNNSKTGLKIINSKYLSFDNCNIKNTQTKIIELIQAKSITYTNSILSNNKCTRGCLDFLGNQNSIEFTNVAIKENKYTGKSTDNIKLITGQNKNITFKKSKFTGNQNFNMVGLDTFNLVNCDIQKF